MERSFSIVDEDELNDISENFDEGRVLRKYSSLGGRKTSLDEEEKLSRILDQGSPQKISGRQTVLKTHPLTKPKISSDSDLDDSDLEEDKPKDTISGEYNPKDYENLDVTSEIKEIFHYITKYSPQQMSLDFKFKPFVPEFLPAVGDIDAFLKVIPPSKTVERDDFTANQQLGLLVLDEPASNQSDAALLHLHLRAESVSTHDSDVVVKKIHNVEKSAKTIDKWIKDISALHKSKSFPVVKYTEVMPDLDDLMQEWPEDMEKKMKEEGFPEPKGSLDDYIEEICGIFQIPSNNKVQALHLFFSLYAAVKSSQLFKNTQLEKEKDNEQEPLSTVADQLVLD